jgi:hypothetical protein
VKIHLRGPRTSAETVHLQLGTVFGDLRLRSLTPRESPSRWRAALDRLAGRPPLPPPPVPPRL